MFYSAKRSAVKKRNIRRREDDDLSESENDDENCACIYCLKQFKQSKPGAQWIQCTKCNRWAHDHCTRVEIASIYFVCMNCESNFENDSSSSIL